MLEDAPTEPEVELVGKGNDWMAGKGGRGSDGGGGGAGRFLEMDLEEKAVWYVTSVKNLKDMKQYLEEVRGGQGR